MKEILKDFNIKVKVEQLYNKNQFVIYYRNAENPSQNIVVFQSYTTIIAIYEPNTRVLNINWHYWDYSKTTSKHLKLFINEYTPFDYDNKTQFEKFLLSSEDVKLFE